MAHYHYDPALPVPGKWTGIDFSNPSLQPALRMLIRSIKTQVSDFVPPEGVRMRTEQQMSRDGVMITCYIFEPEMAEEKLPAMLYCHGGGFFLPIQPAQLSLACRYAKDLGIRVYLPEYRTYPEYVGAYPYLDCQCVLERVIKEAEESGKKYLLYGDSAGGAVAAALALEITEKGQLRAAGQVLIYPALDNRCSRYPSVRLYSEATWPLKNNLAMWRVYLQDKMDVPEKILVPMKATDLSGLPSTYIEPQEIDTLRDEAVAYVGRLVEAGVPVVLNLIKGSYHGFDSNPDNAFVQKVLEQRISHMRNMLV